VFSVPTILNKNFMTQKFTEVVGWLTDHREDFVTCPATESLYAEMEKIEQTLSKISTKPIKAIREDSKPVHPITERQRLMDLAG
jgi:hypothetical protein